MTPEQNLRRVLIDNLPRDRLIELIAKHLFNASRRGYKTRSANDAGPKDWYSKSFFRTR